MRNFQKFYISVLIILCLFLNNACSKAPEADSPFLPSFNQQEQQYYMVDIRGEVNRPGIYKVESGAMINDVIELAGGLTYHADISKINLVEIINDNKKIVISRVTNNETKEEPKKEDNKININTCTKSDLMKLSGIGSTKAQAIINYRDKNGKFKKIEDLLKVNGIGEALLLQIKEYITV